MTIDKDQASTEATKKPEFSNEELNVIFDEIIFSGEYKEDVIIKGKLKVTFRSRTADEVNAITKELDSQTHTLISTLQERTAFLNVVYSTAWYAGKDISGMKIEDKKAFIGKLPAVVIGAISEALLKFDSKVAKACMVGEENF